MRTHALIALALAAALSGCAGDQPQSQAAAAPSPQALLSPTPDPALGSLKITDEVLGTGPEAVSGKRVSVDYTGRLLTGAQFDTSVGRGPFSFVLGAGQVIKGWDLGVAGMKVGGKRQIVIPPYLAYGENGQGPIPPNATLVFDVELLGVQ
jgi:FKBP-type peptidyl-prolyl cis-trans isomerase